MNMKSLVAAVALCIAAPAMAACTKTFSLGSLGPPDFALFGNSYNSAQKFEDCYSFSLTAAADAAGVVFEWDASNRFDIDLSLLSVSSMGNSVVRFVHEFGSPLFRFEGLGAGTYQLALAGEVTVDHIGRSRGAVGYSGMFSTSTSRVAAPVPEPEALAMFALGLGVVGWSLRPKG